VKLTTSLTPGLVRVNTELVDVTVRSVCAMPRNAGAFARLGAPMNTYGVPSIRAMPVIAVTWPFQNVGQVPGRLSAGSQVLRYGERTASGVAGGRIGLNVEPVARAPPDVCGVPVAQPASASSGSAATERPAAEVIRSRFRRDRPPDSVVC
jgi:hypothetical protein